MTSIPGFAFSGFRCKPAYNRGDFVSDAGVRVAPLHPMFGPDAEASLTFDELATVVEHRDAVETMDSHPVDKDEMADELASKPRLALGAAKEALTLERGGDPEAGLAFERRAWSGLFGTHDQREGMAAFLEKREPAFE